MERGLMDSRTLEEFLRMTEKTRKFLFNISIAVLAALIGGGLGGYWIVVACLIAAANLGWQAWIVATVGCIFYAIVLGGMVSHYTDRVSGAFSMAIHLPGNPAKFFALAGVLVFGLGFSLLDMLRGVGLGLPADVEAVAWYPLLGLYYLVVPHALLP